MITKYISLDNETFSTENDCLEYEKELLETPIKDLLKTRCRKNVADIISNYIETTGMFGKYLCLDIVSDNDKNFYIRIKLIFDNNIDSFCVHPNPLSVYSCTSKEYPLHDMTIEDIPNLIKDQLRDSLPATVDIIRNNYSNTGDISDGYHTFNQLYYQRCVLFSIIVNSHPDISWKSRRHSDGELCFNGDYFIVGIDTPEGWFTYHYENKYWDMFKCIELNKARKWDGHTEEDITRLFSIK